MNQRDLKYFNVAKAMAACSTWSEEPREQVGAVVVLRNEIIATGYNRKKTNPLQFFFANQVGRPQAIYPHAEISALHKLKQAYKFSPVDYKVMKIYVYRETKQGIALARPCEICMAAIKYFNIQHIYYTTNDGFAEEVFN